MSKVFYKWEDLERDVKKIADEIRDSGYEYEQILAITRGGLIVAGLLSQYLKKCPIETLGISSYEGEMKVNIKVEKLSSSEKKTVICDDIVDTGDTIKKAKELYPNSKVAVLHYKSSNSPDIIPDFFGEDTGYWIVYPWEVNEK